MAKLRCMIFMLALFITFFMITSCTEYVGKKFNRGLDISEKNGLNKIARFNNGSLIEYDYSIDSEAKTITIDGTLSFAPESVPGSNVIRMRVYVVFLDKNKVGLREEYFPINISQSIYEPIPLRKTIPYDDRYMFITFGYKGYAD